MKLRAKFVLLVFGLFYLMIGVFMVLYALDFVSQQDLSFILAESEQLIPLDLLAGLVGAVLIVLVVALLNFVWSGVAAEKNIAFKTEYGEVLVSLSAVEDYVRKIMRDDPDVRDLRSKVTVRKRGLVISLRAVMLSEINIPSVTEKMQSELRRKVQEMLGMEEPVIIKVFISKIGEKERKKKLKQGDETQEVVPPYREF
ncbi:MAG: alkaline shock response membrane anchor protein AmaP [Candidatus Kaelpia aquatica]|nr:alkaline shock response membrane anchor protein AmaP [Candidatus Kaelpia aquatica]